MNNSKHKWFVWQWVSVFMLHIHSNYRKCEPKSLFFGVKMNLHFNWNRIKTVMLLNFEVNLYSQERKYIRVHKSCLLTISQKFYRQITWITTPYLLSTIQKVKLFWTMDHYTRTWSLMQAKTNTILRATNQ